jgi:hypothetical protein
MEWWSVGEMADLESRRDVLITEYTPSSSLDFSPLHRIGERCGLIK